MSNPNPFVPESSTTTTTTPEPSTQNSSTQNLSTQNSSTQNLSTQNSSTQNPNNQPPKALPEKKKKGHKWRNVFILTLILFIIILAVSYTGNPGAFGDTDPNNPDQPPQDTVDRIQTIAIVLCIVAGILTIFDTWWAYGQRIEQLSIEGIEGNTFFLLFGFGSKGVDQESAELRRADRIKEATERETLRGGVRALSR
jgi:hypothetical protein